MIYRIEKYHITERHYSFIFEQGSGKPLETDEGLQQLTWTIIDPPDADLVIGDGMESPSNDATSATVWLSGGTAGVTYQLRGAYESDHVPPQTDAIYVSVRILPGA